MAVNEKARRGVAYGDDSHRARNLDIGDRHRGHAIASNRFPSFDFQSPAGLSGFWLCPRVALAGQRYCDDAAIKCDRRCTGHIIGSIQSISLSAEIRRKLNERNENPSTQNPPAIAGGFAAAHTGAARSYDPDGIRTRVAALKGPCPRPLDDRAMRKTIALPA